LDEQDVHSVFNGPVHSEQFSAQHKLGAVPKRVLGAVQVSHWFAPIPVVQVPQDSWQGEQSETGVETKTYPK
jgi:hypothetical protein